jgi:hypothetical protein
MLQSLVIGRSRRPRRSPYFLALLAMLIQFAVSFGHFHAQNFQAHQSGYTLAITQAQGASGGAGQGLAGDVDCPICSSIQQLGSTALLDGAPLRLPRLQHAGLVLVGEPLRLTSPPHLLFDTRGPPVI